MVQPDKLSTVLSDFARTMSTDFPIQGILDHLVERIVNILPITGAGVTLISADLAPRYVAASDAAALRFEQLQTDLGQGPCLAAYQSGQAVPIPDLAVDGRFPKFAPAAMAAGLAAVFTFPLRQDRGRLGALDLYRDTPGRLGRQRMSAAQTLADVAAAYLLNAQAREETRATADHYRHQALHDPLTGLPNRLLLQQRLQHAARRAHRSRTHAAILFVDLDRFKLVNDTHGHDVGDQLLVAVAHRLSSLIRPGDTLARFAGDEFVFLCEDLHGAADAEVLAQRIEEAFTHPFELADTQPLVTASIGMAYAGPGQGISEQLLVDADAAMFQAKRKGGAGHQVIDLREALKASARNNLELDLRVAFAQDKLEIAYQPIVRGLDRLVTGVEALLRWTDPLRGAVSPRAMVAAAEMSGLISQIGGWVLERACREHVRWRQARPDAALQLAVNVSARQLMSPGYCAGVADVLAGTGMDPAALILEVTEDIFTADNDRATTVLTALKERGIRIALDDFGTGYSSLSHLRRLPIDIVKIDQSFLADIGHAPTGGTMVAALTNLAHVLGFTVTAEGVETQTQHDEVNAVGCDYAQGYYYAQPMPAAAIGAQLGAPPANPYNCPHRTMPRAP